MRLFAVIVGLFLAAVIFTAGSPQVNAQAQPNQKQAIEKRTKKYVKVKSGDSLSKIARRNNTNYKRLFYANKKIENPDLIFVGDKIRVPNKNEELKKRPLNVSAAKSVDKKPVRRNSVTSQPKRTYTRQRSLAPPPSSANGGVWDRLASCESGGNWSINTGNGYYGGLQFSLSSWRGVGGSGYPHQASKAEQIRRAEILRASGGWGHWPACSAKLGLR